MTGSQPRSEKIPTEDLWQILFIQAFLFAAKYINRLRWRGTFGGVLPDGDDAESIAAQAVTDFLQQTNSRFSLSLGERVRVRAGFVASYSLPRSISSPLSRLVWRHVDRLHHRYENLLLRNEADLAPACINDEEVCRFIETLPEPGGNAYDNLVHKETTAEFESLQTEFRKFLGRERRLKSLFTCYANGIWLPRDVASRLHLSASATRNLQKRLKRRFQRFLEQQSRAE